MEHFNDCCSIELIDSNDKFNLDGVRKFQEHLRMAPEGCPDSIVSIIGPQSSGKSTLLNHLFGTDFKEMDAQMGRLQTTSGIWVAKSRLLSHCVLVIDTEGSDGAERQDDTKFEKQAALFALAISNTVIINMMCTDLGRNNGAGWPLLRTVFEVMIRKFSTPRKVRLVFVLRDKTKSPLDKLEKQLSEQVQKIKVEAMVNYEEKQEQFKEEVVSLRERIICCTTSGEVSSDGTAASGFAEYAKKIWDDIKDNKDLDLPSYKIMVAELRCNEIAREKYESFLKDNSWLQIKKNVESGRVEHFGKNLSSLIDCYLSKYDDEALYFVESVRANKRKQQIEILLEVVDPAYKNVLKHLRYATMNSFKKTIDIKMKNKTDVNICTKEFLVKLEKLFADSAIDHAKSDHPSQQLDKLKREMDAYIDKARDEIRQREEHNRELDRVRHEAMQRVRNNHDNDDESLQVVLGIVAVIGLVVGLPIGTSS